MAVQANYFSFRGSRGSQIGLHLATPRRNCLGFAKSSIIYEFKHGTHSIIDLLFELSRQMIRRISRPYQRNLVQGGRFRRRYYVVTG